MNMNSKIKFYSKNFGPKSCQIERCAGQGAQVGVHGLSQWGQNSCLNFRKLHYNTGLILEVFILHITVYNHSLKLWKISCQIFNVSFPKIRENQRKGLTPMCFCWLPRLKKVMCTYRNLGIFMSSASSPFRPRANSLRNSLWPYPDLTLVARANQKSC